jgi:hypothetical protein
MQGARGVRAVWALLLAGSREVRKFFVSVGIKMLKKEINLLITIFIIIKNNVDAKKLKNKL